MRFFFFNDTATTEIYTLSLHDALPISYTSVRRGVPGGGPGRPTRGRPRSEEHTSELQSPDQLVCRLLLEKKKKSLHSRPHPPPSPAPQCPRQRTNGTTASSRIRTPTAR